MAEETMQRTHVVYRTVLFGDCDPEGIVYTPRFASVALEATHEAMAAWLGGPAISTLKAMGVLTPVRAFNLEFLAPVPWDATLELEVGVTKVSTHAFTMAVHGFLLGQVPAFSASVTYVTVSSTSKLKTRLPQRLCQVLGGFGQNDELES